MKLCPVCNETFEDDMRFCDLDGTRLKRDVEAPAGQSKIWSLLGVGLLVGALVISAASVFFLPKARISPTAASNDSTAAKDAAGQTTVAQANPTEAPYTPEIVVQETPAEVKKKDKSASLANSNASDSELNPKAAAQIEEEAEKRANKTDNPTVALPVERKPEPAPAVKPVSETKDTEAAPKSVQTTMDKKDPKRSARDAEKEADAKKKAEEKKKGGFFRFVKKIFSKD